VHGALSPEETKSLALKNAMVGLFMGWNIEGRMKNSSIEEVP
jgi:hypothetical protein